MPEVAFRYALPRELADRFVGVRGKLLLKVYARGNVWDMDRLATFVRDVESIEQRTEVLHAGFDVRADAHLLEGARHDLEVASRAGRGREPRVAARLVQADGAREVEIHAIPLRVPPDVRFDQHELAVHAEKAGREVIERQNAVRHVAGARRRGARARLL